LVWTGLFRRILGVMHACREMNDRSAAGELTVQSGFEVARRRRLMGQRDLANV
jgi:hypothetical protein